MYEEIRGKRIPLSDPPSWLKPVGGESIIHNCAFNVIKDSSLSLDILSEIEKLLDLFHKLAFQSVKKPFLKSNETKTPPFFSTMVYSMTCNDLP